MEKMLQYLFLMEQTVQYIQRKKYYGVFFFYYKVSKGINMHSQLYTTFENYEKSCLDWSFETSSRHSMPASAN